MAVMRDEDAIVAQRREEVNIVIGVLQPQLARGDDVVAGDAEQFGYLPGDVVIEVEAPHRRDYEPLAARRASRAA